MKLSIELNDEKWIFNYEIGESRHNTTRQIDADSFCAFANILKYANDASNYDNKKVWDEIKAKAWIEGNAEEALEFAKKQIK